MTPGVNGTGKYTGTVPKSKTPNDRKRDTEQRRDASINNIPNNLSPNDWQQIPDAPQNLSLKHSNARACDSDCYEIDGSLSHELDNRRRCISAEEQGVQNSFLPAGFPPATIKSSPHAHHLRHNTQRIGCFPSQSVHPSQQSYIQPCITMASDEEEGASSFDSFQFSQIGERNGGVQEWMGPGGSGEGRASRNHISPSASEQQIRGSKGREERDRNILPGRENKSNISKMPDRNQVLSRLNQIRDYINQTTSLMDRMQSSRDPRVAAEYFKLTKMLQGLKDSEKKLEDLLSTLKNLAESETASLSGNSMLENVDYDHLQRFSQLLEVLKKQEDMYLHLCSQNWVKMKQEIPDGRSSARNLSREKELTPQLLSQNDMVNSLPDFTRSDLSPSENKSKLDCLKERIQALKELYENRNQLMELLGDEDEELSSEHQVLQNKIEDLQQKKNQMDHLVQELRTLNCFIPDEDGVPEATNGPQSSSVGTSQQMAVGDAEKELPERDIQEVLKNMEELKQMKERLAILQGLISTDNQVQATVGNATGNDMASTGEKEDHSVALRRQKEHRKKQPSCSKPDNISLSSEAGSISDAKARELLISSQELEQKTLKLQEAKLRLQQLEKLLEVVQENRNDGLSSDEYAQLVHAVKDGISQQQRNESGEQAQMNSEQLQSTSKQQRNFRSENGGPNHNNNGQPFSSSSSMHSSRDIEAALLMRSSSPIPPSTELSVEALQAMTQNLKQQAMSIRAERERIAAVKWQLGQRQQGGRQSPCPSTSASSSSRSSSGQRDKNRNSMEMDTRWRRQLLLQAELQAKRRELEELMRKDLGHQASINQDMSHEMSASKSDATSGFNHINAEGTTTNATWGGSTQGTLDDLAERDIEIRDQGADFSSDDGKNEEESAGGAHYSQPIQDHKIAQLNVSVAREQPSDRSQSAHREMLNISLESQGRRKGSVNSNKAGSNASSSMSNQRSKMQAVSRSSPGRSPVRVTQGHNLQQSSHHGTPGRSHVPSSHNVWKKDSMDNSVPRAIWTPSSAHGRQENVSLTDEVAAESVMESNTATAGSSVHPSMSSINPQPLPNSTNSNQNSSSWWQQQAQQLQNQLEAITSLCQSLMTEQQHHGNGSSCPFSGINQGYNMNATHPIGVATPSSASSWPFNNFPPPWMMAPSPFFHAPDHSQTPINLHSYASHQLQQQQHVLQTLSQCCQLLWHQHRELATLQATVQTIQDRLGQEPRQDEDELRNIQLQQSQMQQPVNPHPLLYHNRVSAVNTQSSFSVPQAVSSNLLLRRAQKPVQMQSPYPEVVREVSEVSSVQGAANASGVASAHSLPNLCTTGTAVMGLPHLISQTADAHPSPTAAYSFPSESLHQPPPPLGPSSYAHGDHWALHPSAAAVARGPPVALNNQVPPGIRANNYWDNFRSYSRQNLLSTSSKSNEGYPHIPSPLVMRSHNFLRSHGPSLQTSGLNASPAAMPPVAQHILQSQKEKQNTEQHSGVSQQHNVNRVMPNPTPGSEGSHYRGFPSQDLAWELQPSQRKDEQPSLPEDSSRRHASREGSGLFQILRESVYSEVATLIAQNENRPHYLIQLFKDLQMVSCDALRQRTLLSIHRLVSRYIQENGKDPQSSLLSDSVVDTTTANPRECDSSDEEEIQERSHLIEGRDDRFSSSPFPVVELERKNKVGKSENLLEHQETLQSSIDSFQDGGETMNENIQSMLHQLLPLLKPHLDEPSSFMLLQNICLLAFQFLSSNINADGNKSKDSPLNTSLSFHQLNSLLEETCLKFEGCKLKDVGEELLISIGEVLIKAIKSSNQELIVRPRNEDTEEGEEEILKVMQERTEEVAEEDRNIEIEESNEGVCYDEDLAEADQSLDSNEIIISDARESQKRFSITKETKGNAKETDGGNSSFSCDDGFAIIIGAEEDNVEKQEESVEEMVIHGSEDFLECNGNDNDNKCCNADELGAEALIEIREDCFSREESEPLENTDISQWDDQKPAKENGANELSSTSLPHEKPCSSNAFPKASSGKTAQKHWVGSDDDTDVVIGDEAGLSESNKGDTCGSI